MNKISKEYIDDLTGLCNRRYLDISAQKNIEKAKNKGEPLSILMVDLDHFKNVNDSYGHSRGDAVLKEFSVFFDALLRSNDMVFRYGGDEFVCILPNTDYKQAEKFSHRLIKICRGKEFAKIRLTLSIGIASFPHDAKNWQDLFEIADRNLYSAKHHGRDRIGIFESDIKGLHIPTAEIVGRDEEVDSIKKFVTPIFDGKGGAVCISGEIGVGKTRLVQEIAKDPDFRNIRFLSSNLSATTRSISYYPFREIIRAVIENCGMGFMEGIPKAYQIELMKIVPELSTKVEENKQMYMVDKFRLFEGVRRFLEQRASHIPLFIFLDNVHWADDVSLDLLHYLVRALRENPIYFFLVYRIEEASGGLFQDILDFMSREGLYKRVNLGLLKSADVARMLSFVLDCSPQRELTEYIIKKTGGNPFFIEELMKSLKENNALLWANGKWIFKKDRKMVIPHSVEGVVERKMKMIEEESYKLLEYGAVIGREFNFKFLQDVTGINEGHLFDLMDGVLKVKLLKELEEERYYFSEDIIRGIIYGRIGSVKLKRYHQRVGKILLNLYRGHTEEIVEELAYHFYESGDCKKAIKYSMTAGDRARDAYANQNAITFYGMAIECLSRDGIKGQGTKLIECLRKRAKVLRLIGENEKAISDLEKGVNKSRALRDKKAEADCLHTLGGIYQDIAKYKEARKTEELALRIYRELDNRAGEASSLNNIGILYWYNSKYDKALEYYRQSLRIEKEIGNLRGVASIFNNIGLIYGQIGEYSKTLKFLQKALKIEKNVGNRISLSAILGNIGIAYEIIGKYSKALEYLNRSLKITEETGDRMRKAVVLSNIGVKTNYFGKPLKALEFYKRSLEIQKDIGDKHGEAINIINMGNIYFELGKYEEALEAFRSSLRIEKKINNRNGEFENLKQIGNVLLEKNDFVNAKKYYDRAYAIATSIKSKKLVISSLLGIISFHIEKNNISKAKKRLEEVLTLVKGIDSEELKTEIFYLSGRIYTKEKKWDKAKFSFSQAISFLKKSKGKFKLAQVYFYQGLMFKEMGDNTDAKKYYARAKRIFKSLGAKFWIEKLEKQNRKKNNELNKREHSTTGE